MLSFSSSQWILPSDPLVSSSLMLAEVKHQEEGTKFLRRFVEGSLETPLLLVGPSGVGRRFSVQKAVQELFCVGSREVGCPCPSCYDLMRGQHPDLIVVSADEKDIGVDRVRKLIADAQVRPGLGSVRCFIVDGADLFTVPAADAFLKTLEEPPESARFFLIAEERERVLPTLRSRCGLVRYGPLPDDFVSSVVVESVGEGEETAKALICARLGEGSVGRAVGYWNSGKIALRDQVLRVLQLAVQRDWSALFSAVDAMDRDLPLALKFLEQISHDVLMVRVDPMRALNADCLDELKDLGLKASVRSWFTVSQKTRELLQQRRSTPLNLSFHFKTRLVESFLL